MIYFVQDSTTCHIKIGFNGNEDVQGRVRQLQTGCPSRLVLLGTCEGSQDGERELHRKFAEARTSGEWFRPVPELLQLILSKSACAIAAKAVAEAATRLHNEQKIRQQWQTWRVVGSQALFPHRLLAQYAVFFNLNDWQWGIQVCCEKWRPDFYLKFPCGHSECPGFHSLFVAVEPFETIEEFKDHPCLKWRYGRDDDTDESIGADAGAAFGIHPSVSYWEMAHGSGGGEETLERWVNGDMDALWKRADAMVESVIQ